MRMIWKGGMSLSRQKGFGKLMGSSTEYVPLQTLMEGTTRVAARVMAVASAVAAASVEAELLKSPRPNINETGIQRNNSSRY